MKRSDSKSEEDFFRFTGKQRFEKSIHTLHGILLGIGADGVIKKVEVSSLVQWISDHKQYQNRHPFSEVIPILKAAVSDGVVDDEEYADLVWVTERLISEKGYWDDITSDMQELHGFLHGILADGIINEAELNKLSDWVDARSHLRACWPYDELEAIIADVMEDGKIDAQEHQALLDFFSEFTGISERKSVGAIDRSSSVSGVCAFDPEVVFPDKIFCFTGKADRGSRKVIESAVTGLGAVFGKDVTKRTNYLVIGAEGNPCWAYACYGRKIEKAVGLRRMGQKLLIVHEYDFWDAVEDQNA